MLSTSLRTLAVTLLLVTAAIPARADLIVNGGFEDLQRNPHTWGLYHQIPGWHAGEFEYIELQNRVAGAPYEGNQHVELDSTKPSSIFQNVATAAGQTYRLSFAFAGRPGTSLADENVMRIYWNGHTVATLTAPHVTPNWTVYTYDVVASSSSTLLGFGDVSQNLKNSYGVYLDDVRLSAVPEPGTLALFGLGLLGLGFSRRSKT